MVGEVAGHFRDVVPPLILGILPSMADFLKALRSTVILARPSTLECIFYLAGSRYLDLSKPNHVHRVTPPKPG